MKRIVSVALILVFAATMSAQSYRGRGRLAGKVMDEQGKPLAGVTVKLYSVKGASGLEIRTNADGEWIANYIRGGGWNLDFELSGYETHKMSTNIQENNQNPPIPTVLKRSAEAAFSDEVLDRLKEGNALFDQKKFPDAIQAYEALVAAHPEVYLAYRNIGNAWFELQDYDKAEAAYSKVLEKEPSNPDILMLIGNCYTNRGNDSQAMIWYAKIEFEKITDPTVLYNIGSSLTKAGKPEDALRYYRRSVELNTTFADGFYQLGLTYLALQKSGEALAAFENYLKIDVDSPRAGQVRGFVDFLKKK